MTSSRIKFQLNRAVAAVSAKSHSAVLQALCLKCLSRHSSQQINNTAPVASEKVTL